MSRRWLSVMTLLLPLLPFAPRRLCGADSTPAFRLARFSADITIPLGHRCMGILPVKAQAIEDPLEALGFVLQGEGAPIVLLALDWCEVRNGAYDQWREALAEAAGTTRDRVLVCSLHQHDAPVTDNEAQVYLDQVGMERELFDREFQRRCIERVTQAVTEALKQSQPVTHIGVGQARVERVASNRRFIRSDGTVTFDRGSASGNSAAMADAPEGLIDPWLKTISFWNGEEPLLALHAYATHPMSYYGRGGVSADFVGLARRRRQRDQPQVMQIYVSGCSGDITAGRYNDGSPAMRSLLADRIYQAMNAAWNDSRQKPLSNAELRNEALHLEFIRDPQFERPALLQTLNNETAHERDRILAAMSLSSRDRLGRGQPIDIPCIDLGVAQILLLPGEAFVGYQLMAQEIGEGSFVMCLGYGECWPGYIPTESAFADGFDHGWRWVARGSEQRVRRALEAVLRPQPAVQQDSTQ